MRNRFERQLLELNNELIQMGSMIERAIEMGISALVRGMSAREAVERLKGIRCGAKSTSCPDQLAQGLEQILAQQEQ